VIKEDALLGTFLTTESSFEQWRKHSSISLEEESASKRIDRVEEMTIPSDLEDKLGYVIVIPPLHLIRPQSPQLICEFCVGPLGMSDRRLCL
jgi:hypothetical protein